MSRHRRCARAFFLRAQNVSMGATAPGHLVATGRCKTGSSVSCVLTTFRPERIPVNYSCTRFSVV
jgi:hypothetical protein